MKANIQSKAGFTLIELIVVAAIIVTLTGLGIAGYNSFNQKQILKQSAEEVKSNLRDAQNRALSGEKVYPDCDNRVLNYWVFTITSATEYKIEGSCDSSTFGSKSFTLPNGLTFTTTGINIYFKPLAHGTTNSTTVTITLSQSSSGNTISLTVSPSGEITIGDII